MRTTAIAPENSGQGQDTVADTVEDIPLEVDLKSTCIDMEQPSIFFLVSRCFRDPNNTTI